MSMINRNEVYGCTSIRNIRYSRNFSKVNLTGLRTFLGAIPELQDVDDINSMIIEAIHEADS